MPEYIIGRSASADIQIGLNEPTVSRQHAKLIEQGERWLLEDLNSTNGTFILGGIGKKKVSSEFVDEKEYVYFGDYKIQLSALVSKIHRYKSLSGSPQAEPENKPKISRYLKTEDGRFVRKEK